MATISSLKGGFAEYAIAPESALTLKPSELTFVEASTIPQAGAIALQGTSTGRGGAAGADQRRRRRLGLVRHPAGEAAAVRTSPASTTPASSIFMRSLGADEVIDYRSEDFTRGDTPYDLILDLVAHRSVFAYRRALAAGGRYRCVGGPARALLRVVTIGWLAGRLTGRSLGVLAVKMGPAHFGPLAARCVAGDVRIYIDRTFGLDDVPEALAHVGEGRALGKVVVVPNSTVGSQA